MARQDNTLDSRTEMLERLRKEVGLDSAQKKSSAAGYLSKREVIHLVGWITAAKQGLKNND